MIALHTWGFSMGFIMQARQQLQGSIFYLLGNSEKQERNKKKPCDSSERKRNRETNCHCISAKEEELVFLSFVFFFENNLYCVIVRFECIGVWV